MLAQAPRHRAPICAEISEIHAHLRPQAPNPLLSPFFNSSSSLLLLYFAAAPPLHCCYAGCLLHLLPKGLSALRSWGSTRPFPQKLPSNLCRPALRSLRRAGSLRRCGAPPVRHRCAAVGCASLPCFAAADRGFSCAAPCRAAQRCCTTQSDLRFSSRHDVPINF